MRICATTLALVLLFSHLSSHSQSLVWAKQIASPSWKNVNSITVDDNGNVYTTGNFSTSADFDPGPDTYNLTAAGSGTTATDVFISKLNAAGQFVWAKQFGGTNIDYAGTIDHDKNGNIYVTGSFQNTADFDPGPGVYNMLADSGAHFLLKLDASGNFLFAKQMRASPKKATIDSAGNILIAFDIVGGSVDFDPGPSVFTISNVNNDDIVICKLTAQGDFVWAKQIAGTNSEMVSKMITDKDNNVFVCGYFYGTCDFDPGPSAYNLTSAGISDMFLAKLDASGNFVWAKQMGGTERESLSDIKFDPLGNIVATGVSEGGGDFDPGPASLYLNGYGASDMILVKLTNNGNLVWVKRIGSATSEDGEHLSIDHSGNITVVGAMNGPVDLDPGNSVALLSPAGLYDIFIAKYDSSGNFLYDRQIGGKGWDACNSTYTDKSENIIMTGTFQDAVDFDPGPKVYTLTGPVSTSSTPMDIFIARFTKSNQITGITFSDANHDGTRQANELLLPNIPVEAKHNGVSYKVRSDNSGTYVIYADTGSYSISVPAIAYYPLITPATHSANFGSALGVYDTANHFALQPTPGVQDLRVALTNVTATRRGFNAIFYLTFQNIGTIPMSGNVKVALDRNLSLVNSEPAQNSYTYPDIMYTFTNLGPSQVVNARLVVAVDMFAPFADTMKTVAVISPTTGDVAPYDNADTLRTIVTGSFDPNDKSVMPAGSIHPEFISSGRYLDYTVRFQNTGNDTAFTVVLKDTLSSFLDVTSLQMVSASHDYTIAQEGNNIEWHFDNILLPDSNHNEPKSHGFIRFRIKPKSSVSAGAEIKNKAAIYFDFNTAVFTNTTNTHVEVITATNDPDTVRSIKLFPNPADSYVQLKCKGSFNYTLYSASGQQVIPLFAARNEAVINTTKLQKGVYFLEVKHSGKTKSYKIIVQ